MLFLKLRIQNGEKQQILTFEKLFLPIFLSVTYWLMIYIQNSMQIFGGSDSCHIFTITCPMSPAPLLKHHNHNQKSGRAVSCSVTQLWRHKSVQGPSEIWKSDHSFCFYSFLKQTCLSKRTSGFGVLKMYRTITHYHITIPLSAL